MTTISYCSAQNLLWSDEFNGSSLDLSVWTYALGDGCAEGICGWGNQELQTYTDQNTTVSGGYLHITAKRENLDGKEFTSARLLTKDKVSVQYGRIEASIKLPNMNNGLWPAFWMLGDGNRWPYTGEIDIMEAGFDAINTDANRVAKANVFWRAEDAGVTANLQFGNEDAFKYDAQVEAGTSLNQEFFVYRVDWTPTSMTTYVLQTDSNGNPIESTAKEIFNITNSATFQSEFFTDDNFYILLNMAVGGWLPFNPNDGTNVPSNVTALPNLNSSADMVVDYVRVYDLNGVGEITLGNVEEELLSANGFGIFSDNTSSANQLNYGVDAEVFVWEDQAAPAVNLETTSNAFGAEGYRVTFPANQWAGFTLNSSDILNLENYTNGSLRFKMKTTSQEPFRISMGTTAGEAGVNFIVGQNQFGLIRDGSWHDVEIPLGLLVTSFKQVTTPFTIGNIENNNPTSTSVIEIDEIYLSAQPATNYNVIKPAIGDFGVYTESAVADEFTLGTDGELYVWGNTLNSGPLETYNGQQALSYVHNNQGWFGFAFTANQLYDLSAYNNGFLNIAMKSNAAETIEMRVNVGLASGLIVFESGNDPYGFARDGQWHQLQIPVSDFVGLNTSGVLTLLSISGGGNISDIAVADIYFTCNGPCSNNGGSSQNLALGGSASQSTDSHGGVASKAIDGNTSGIWSEGSVTHTTAGIGQWWQVDLGSTKSIGEIKISNRTDCCTFRLNDITVSVRNSSGVELWSQNITSSSAPLLLTNAGGVSGQIIRITQNTNNALSLAEVEVYESSGTPTVPSGNLALGRPTDQTSTAHGGASSRAVDGNTSGNWGNSSITHTNAGIGESWEVSLADNFPIGEITIYNRTNCCSHRLNNITVSVEDLNGNISWSQNVTSSSVASLTLDAGGATGQVIRVTQNQNTALSLAEVEVYASTNTASAFPDPTKKYYIDIPIHNLRLAATGASEDPYTTASNSTGADVEWQFVQHSSGNWHIQRAAGGTLPRLRTDNTLSADMQATSSSGINTYFQLDEGFTPNTYFLTLPDAQVNFQRLQVDNLGNVKFVGTNSAKTWESFQITEVTSTYARPDFSTEKSGDIKDASSISARIYPIPAKDILNLSVDDHSAVKGLEIFDLAGKRYLKKSKLDSQNTKIDVSFLKSGIYLLRIYREGQGMEALKFSK
ncbi:MAG: discoidin domain-containing protein [Bacteroidota bacterium]